MCKRLSPAKAIQAVCGALPTAFSAACRSLDRFIGSATRVNFRRLSLDRSGFERFEGTIRDDHFSHLPGGLSATLIGDGGDNRLTLGASSEPTVVNLNTQTATGITRFEDFSTIEAMQLSHVIGPNQNTTWRIDDFRYEMSLSNGMSC